MYLGIDIGTSKTAVALVDHDGTVVDTIARTHGATIPADAQCAEQDAYTLMASVTQSVRELPAEYRARVAAIGVTGQMHGVLLVDKAGQPVSPLITWEDQRCAAEPGFLDDLEARTGFRVHTGYGCATLAWLAQHNELPRGAAGACTIHDFVVARLCALKRICTDETDAASWGMFDLDNAAWLQPVIRAAGIPPALLPVVVRSGRVAGRLTGRFSEALELPRKVPVMAAIGDTQASLLATLSDAASQVALTLGTGGQLSVVLTREQAATVDWARAACEQRPFPGDRRLAAAACLAGGAAWSWLADTVTTWCLDLGLTPPARDAMFATLNALGLAAEASLAIAPHFRGERHMPDARAEISEIDSRNFTLGSVARSLARGIVRTLRQMMPPALLQGRQCIVGSGNALRRNELLRVAAEEELGLPLVMGPEQEEAAVGAALLAAGRCEGA